MEKPKPSPDHIGVQIIDNPEVYYTTIELDDTAHLDFYIDPDNVAHIENVTVKEESRGMGYGSKIHKKLIEYLKSKNIDTLKAGVIDSTELRILEKYSAQIAVYRNQDYSELFDADLETICAYIDEVQAKARLFKNLGLELPDYIEFGVYIIAKI